MFELTQPTPDHVRRRIIELYVVSLLSMREIATQTGCSVSNVSNVLKEEERRDPSLSKIRDICNILNESNITPLEFERYVNFLSKFDDHDINLDIFSKFLPILEEYGSDAGSIMKAAIQLYELVKETGKSYHELLQEYKNKLELLTRMEGNLSELKPKEDMLRSSIRWLEASKVLQDTLDANNIDISMLSQFIEIHEGLREMGFNLHVASALAKVLSKLGLTPMRAVAQLEKILAKCPDLMMTINQLEEEERNISAKVSLLNDQVKISAQNKANIEELVRVLYETKSIEEANISSL